LQPHDLALDEMIKDDDSAAHLKGESDRVCRVGRRTAEPQVSVSAEFQLNQKLHIEVVFYHQEADPAFGVHRTAGIV
jgi:hypothetical protein